MADAPKVFLEGQYLITFVGTTSGVVECDSVAHLRSTLEDTYPNPGDPVRGFLLNPKNWQVLESDDMPFFVDYGVFTAEDDYRVFVVRKAELES